MVTFSFVICTSALIHIPNINLLLTSWIVQASDSLHQEHTHTFKTFHFNADPDYSHLTAFCDYIQQAIYQLRSRKQPVCDALATTGH